MSFRGETELLDLPLKLLYLLNLFKVCVYDCDLKKEKEKKDFTENLMWTFIP